MTENKIIENNIENTMESSKTNNADNNVIERIGNSQETLIFLMNVTCRYLNLKRTKLIK